MILMKRSLALASVALLAGSLTACGESEGSTVSAETSAGDTTATGSEPAGPVLAVAAAFYPIELAVQRIGGDRVTVTTLTQPGADPHDAELTPRQVGELGSSDLVVYLSAFQPAIDDAVDSVAGEGALDVAEYANLTLTAVDDGHGHGHEEGDDHGDEEGDDHGDEEGDDHGDEEGDDHGDEATDPHFWLDPNRYASVAAAIADRLAELDPEGAQEYETRGEEFANELAVLDEEFSTGLATCTHRDLVTGHAAFGYLADRYDLRQKGISGLSPENEPSAAAIRDLVEHVRETGVTTVYAETLVSPALAETIAREAGVQVAVLDPIEGITDTSAGNDYFEIMRSNLQTLREGQDCA
jgi:zinc transport system substrate-binding protein